MFSNFFRRWRKSRPASEPADVFAELRRQILTTAPTSIGLSPSVDNPNMWGALMETGYSEAAATLVMLVDGTTSLYLSTGGGIIGGGEHESVAKATQSFIKEAEKYFNGLPQTNSFPLPTVGKVRFYFLTYSGAYTTEVDEEELGNNKARLSPLFFKGHEVISLLRMIEERRQ